MRTGLPGEGTNGKPNEENMPVVLRIRGYRFWFYAVDLDEPPHIHVGKEDKYYSRA
jgi:hypothetical protein